MFILTLILGFHDYNKFTFNETDTSMQSLLTNLNDFINNGVTRNIFKKIFDDQDKINLYNRIIDLISNESLIITNKQLPKYYSHYFNLSNTLFSCIPSIELFISNNKEFFQNLQPFFNEFSQYFARIVNVESNIIKSFYDYVLINKENDNITIEKLLNILQIPSSIFPNIQKIITVFETNQPISDFFEGTNSMSQYQIFTNKVKSLRMPDNDEDKFFSISKVIDAFSSGLDVIRVISDNFINNLYQDLLVPIIKSYLIKPINIFDMSINDRSASLINVLTTIQDYSKFCSPDENISIELDGNFKCTLYDYVNEFLSAKASFDEDDNNNQTSIQKVITKISIFSNDEVNLTDVLINDFNISESKVKFIFDLISNLTDSSKSYLNLMEGFKNVDFIYSSLIENLTNAINFINNINNNSNMKYLFEFLNGHYIWLNLTDSMCDFSNDKQICEYSFMKTYVGEDKCEKLITSIYDLSNFLITEERMKDVDKIYQDLILNFTFPIINEIDKPLSNFLKAFYQISMSILNLNVENNDVDFTNLIVRGGNVIDNLVTVIDNLIPTVFKKMPIISYFYSSKKENLRNILESIKNDSNLAAILESIHEGGSVIIEMLKNGYNSYTDMNTTVSDITKGIYPTSFINVYQTAQKISSLNNNSIRIKKFADSITFDSTNEVLLSDSKLNFNDVFPFKYFVLNSDDLTDSMQNDFLSAESLANGFGNEYNDLERILKLIIESSLFPPRNDIKEFAVNSGYDSGFVDFYLNEICSFSQKVANSQLVSTKSAQYVEPKKTKKSGLSGGAIAGIVIAVIIVVILITFGVVYFYYKRKNKPDENLTSMLAL